MQLTELLSVVEYVEADARSLDLEASAHLSGIVETDCPLDGNIFYQSCIKAVLLNHQPIWSQLMRMGRRRFVESLSQNERDVFAAAGLMDDPTPRDVVAWWDGVSGLSRLISDQKKIEQGREAEMLTLERERSKLKDLGIAREPEWPGFDDNFAGYDVLSYEHGPTGLVNRLIEVKSTIASPLRFIITRHEWNKAEKTGDAYIFHIWDMRYTPPILHIRTVDDVAPHIPTDNRKGKWRAAEIPIATQVTNTKATDGETRTELVISVTPSGNAQRGETSG